MQFRLSFFCLLMLSLLPVTAAGLEAHEPRARTPVHFPDILGYRTLKCDFHIHTVFSDGGVWPDVRVEEAWREGLDAIAITDHIEYQPHRDDLPTAHNRSYEIAQPRGDALRLTVIHGSEITRDMPPGHLNAIFLNDSQPLDATEWRDAVREASRQGAFIFWNHPGWDGQQPDGVARWYAEHTELVDAGRLHGIEVVNERRYFPEAHQWCLEKNLTMLSNSDIHAPLNLDYHVHHGDHRPLTLVFAKDASPEALREALFDHRTVVYSGDLLVGREQFLRPLVENSIRLLNPDIRLLGGGSALVQIQNSCDLTLELRGDNPIDGLKVDDEIDLQGGKIVLLQVRSTRKDRSGDESITLRFTVQNAKVTPDRGLDISLPLKVHFEPQP